MNRERADYIGERIWEMQAPEFREQQQSPTDDQLLMTQRLVRQAIALGDVTLEKLERKARELWNVRPVRAYLSKIVRSANELPNESIIAPSQTSSIELYVPFGDSYALERIAEQHKCECRGIGLVSRRVPNRLYPSGYVVSYACRCPIGRAMMQRGGYQCVTRWEEKYGSQRLLFEPRAANQDR